MSGAWSAELALAARAAKVAGKLLSDAYATGAQRVTRKGQLDLVTEVDRASEAAVRRLLQAETPHIPILGEEEGGAWEASTRWVIDPLDGTTNFVHGFPWFAVSIALEVDGRSVVGVILEPIRRRVYSATRGGGARLDGVPIRVSEVQELGDALVATGFPYDRRERLHALAASVRAVLAEAQGLRRAGAASLDLALVAEGRLDAYFEVNLRPWDLAAGHLLVEEAGGRVGDHRGGNAIDARWPAPLATNGHLHQPMIELLERARSSG